SLFPQPPRVHTPTGATFLRAAKSGPKIPLRYAPDPNGEETLDPSTWRRIWGNLQADVRAGPAARFREPERSLILIREKPVLERRGGRRLQTQMAISGAGEDAAARRPLHKTLLHQIGLDNLLDGVPRLAQSRGNGLDAHRPAGKILRDQGEIAPVEGIQSSAVHFQPVE